MSLRLLESLQVAWPLAKRDILARYRGSLVGMAWALLTPLAMVGVYALVFLGVFKLRWGGAEGAEGLGFVLRLFAGFAVFTAVAEVANRSTRLMQDNANLVKRVVFPLHLLGVAMLMQGSVHLLLQLAVLGLMTLVFGEGLRWSWLLLPLALAWLLALQYAAVLFLASLGAYLRDLQHLVPVLMTGLMFLSPVFYPVHAAPPVLEWVLMFNPLTTPIELLRTALFGDPFPVGIALGQGLGLAAALLLSSWLFARLRPGFADVV